jgi:hypothetical protein
MQKLAVKICGVASAAPFFCGWDKVLYTLANNNLQIGFSCNLLLI